MTNELPFTSETVEITQTVENHSPTIGKIALALSKAQMKIKGAVRDSTNPFFKSTYADLASVWDACHEAVNENEIAIIQCTNEGDPQVVVETWLIHSSGEWIRSALTLTPKARDPQGIGSAITYGRRYALAAMVGVCPIDDDAEAAQGRGETPEEAKKRLLIQTRDSVRKLPKKEDKKKVADNMRSTGRYTEEDIKFVLDE